MPSVLRVYCRSITADGVQTDAVQWTSLCDKVRVDNDDCAICLVRLAHRHRQVDVLSCGHAFHTRCIAAMEGTIVSVRILLQIIVVKTDPHVHCAVLCIYDVPWTMIQLYDSYLQHAPPEQLEHLSLASIV